MSTVQFSGTNGFDLKMEMHSSTPTTDVSFDQEFHKHLSHVSQKMDHYITENITNKQVNKSGQTESIICKKMRMFHKNM